ncbi:MAG: MotA/TolQ/ExbB proton channel family protein [Rickettsiales bacterium]|jgi:chemotaxis protein MotA
MSKNSYKYVWVATIIGVVLVAAMVMSGAVNYHYFLNIEGLIIVIGGTVVNAFMSSHREDVLQAFSTIRNMLEKPEITRDALRKDITQLIKWSYILQADDFLGLEKATADKINDPLLRYGMDLVLTAYSSDETRKMMHNVVDAEFERRCAPVTVLRNMAATAPAFGMVGTLVGMIIILNSVGADMANIGGGLAVAMLSTLYGLLLSRLVCLPAADKLLKKEEDVFFHNCMMSEGFALLSEKQRPFYMQDKLNSFLQPSRHINFDDKVHLSSRYKSEVADDDTFVNV